MFLHPIFLREGEAVGSNESNRARNHHRLSSLSPRMGSDEALALGRPPASPRLASGRPLVSPRRPFSVCVSLPPPAPFPVFLSWAVVSCLFECASFFLRRSRVVFNRSSFSFYLINPRMHMNFCALQRPATQVCAQPSKLSKSNCKPKGIRDAAHSLTSHE